MLADVGHSQPLIRIDAARILVTELFATVLGVTQEDMRKELVGQILNVFGFLH